MSKSKRNEYVVEKLKLYVPNKLVRYYRRVVNKKPHKYFGLAQAIERARIPVTTPRFYALAQFYAILSIIPGMLLGYFITIAILPLSILESVGIHFREYFPFQNPELGYQIIRICCFRNLRLLLCKKFYFILSILYWKHKKG